MTWLDLLIKGGPVMALIGACSLAALALLADRAIFLLATRENPHDLDRELRECGGNAARLERALDGRRGAVAALWRGGLAAIPAGPAAIDRAMHAEGLRQAARAERGLSPLGAIITLTPMLGFLGTILGLIRAFMEWERLGANIQVDALAGGMYEAMITTAAGLIVAIPYYLLYSLVNGRVAARARRLEIAHELFLAQFAPGFSPAAASGGSAAASAGARAADLSDLPDAPDLSDPDDSSGPPA